MFNLTLQERKVVLFLISMASLGVGINFALKVNAPLKKFVQVDNWITKVDLNQVSLEGLLDIPGINSKLAKNIITYRNTKGAFKDMEELKQVKGIGDYKYEKLKDLFFIE
jgi:competence protein ComEA